MAKHLLHKKKLEQAIKEYPNSPSLYNLITNIYVRQRKNKEAMKYARMTVEKFPNYFFGTIVLAELLLKENKLEETETLIGNRLTLKQFYPDREEFHISEFVALQAMMSKLATAQGRLDHAYRLLDSIYQMAFIYDDTYAERAEVELRQVIIQMYLKLQKEKALPKGCKLPAMPFF